MNSITFLLSVVEKYQQLRSVIIKEKVAPSPKTIKEIPSAPFVTLTLSLTEKYSPLSNLWTPSEIEEVDPFEETGEEARRAHWMKRLRHSQACLSQTLVDSNQSSELNLCQRCGQGPDKIWVVVKQEKRKERICLPCDYALQLEKNYYQYQSWAKGLRIRSQHADKTPTLEQYTKALREDISNQDQKRFSLNRLESTVEKWTIDYQKLHGKSEEKELLNTNSPGPKA